MISQVSIKKCFDAGLKNLKFNFWDYVLIVIILGILDSMGNGSVLSQGDFDGATKGFLVSFFATFIKPVFDFGARLQFVRGNRGDSVDVKALVEGFKSKDLYIDIILANLIVFICICLGFIALILPGLYVFSRLVLTSYLVMDKDLAPRQALNASWALTRNYWPSAIALMILSFFMIIIGLVLFIIGIVPALIWVKAMFASLYQQIIDSHDEKYLLSLDIEP